MIETDQAFTTPALLYIANRLANRTPGCILSSLQ
jgi:hypothetical protein